MTDASQRRSCCSPAPTRSSSDPQAPPGSPMTLGNMREAATAHLPNDVLATHAQQVSFRCWKLTFLRRAWATIQARRFFVL
jgi:hypothetical protein